MAKRLTPEERAQRDNDRKAAKIAAREAAYKARQDQWEAERLAARQAFEAGLTDHVKSAIAAILKPSSTRHDPYTDSDVDVYDTEFIESLATQLKSRGILSPAQIAIVIKQYDKQLETAAQVAQWPHIEEGQKVAFLARIVSIEQRSNDYGPFWKVKLTAHYGRPFQVNTTAKKVLDVARKCLEEGIRLNVQGTIKWVAPDQKIAILTGRGLYFQEL